MPYKDPEKERARNRARMRAYRATPAANIEKERNKKRDSAYGLRRRHGLRPEDWAALWEAQQGCCYLCGRELDGRIAVDHDHDHCPPKTSCRICWRGLTHDTCNGAIGLAGDDPARLRRFADALEAAQNAYQARKAATPAVVQALLFD